MQQLIEIKVLHDKLKLGYYCHLGINALINIHVASHLKCRFYMNIVNEDYRLRPLNSFISGPECPVSMLSIGTIALVLLVSHTHNRMHFMSK